LLVTQGLICRNKKIDARRFVRHSSSQTSLETAP
jgi:hypothetical protein